MLFDPTLELPRYTWRLQRTYMWEIMLPDIGGMSGANVASFCQDIKFGDYEMEEIPSLRYGAYRAKYAGTLDIPNVTLTFLRPVPDQVTSYLYAWRQRMISSDGFYNPKAAYAFSIYVYLYDTTGAVSNRIQLVGCFPKDLPGWDFNYDSETISKISCTMSVDRVAFGSFASPVYAPDTDTPFLVANVKDTSSSLPSQQTAIKPLSSSPSPVASASPVTSAVTAWLGSLVPGAVGAIEGEVSTSIKTAITNIMKPQQEAQPSLSPLPNGLAELAGNGISWAGIQGIVPEEPSAFSDITFPSFGSLSDQAANSLFGTAPDSYLSGIPSATPSLAETAGLSISGESQFSLSESEISTAEASLEESLSQGETLYPAADAISIDAFNGLSFSGI